VRLEPLQSWFQPAAGPLLSQLRPALAAAALEQAGAEARLLRWAITAVEPNRGLRIEAVLLVETPVAQPTKARVDQRFPGSPSHGLTERHGDGLLEPEGPHAGALTFKPVSPDPRSAELHVGSVAS